MACPALVDEPAGQTVHLQPAGYRRQWIKRAPVIRALPPSRLCRRRVAGGQVGQDQGPSCRLRHARSRRAACPSPEAGGRPPGAPFSGWATAGRLRSSASVVPRHRGVTPSLRRLHDRSATKPTTTRCQACGPEPSSSANLSRRMAARAAAPTTPFVPSPASSPRSAPGAVATVLARLRGRQGGRSGDAGLCLPWGCRPIRGRQSVIPHRRRVAPPRQPSVPAATRYLGLLLRVAVPHGPHTEEHRQGTCQSQDPRQDSGPAHRPRPLRGQHLGVGAPPTPLTAADSRRWRPASAVPDSPDH
jgi:hypothetical protein